MMTPLFIATEKFDRSDGERWDDYIRWANIPHLTEVVSLDHMLCPRIGPEIVDEDWQHNVQENFRLIYFYDLDYLIRRSAGAARRSILGLYRNPDTHIAAAPGSGSFAFFGYDLIDETTQVSALTNCGGFPETFSNEELNQYGLIADFVRAGEIRRLLPIHNPAEHHANCELYAIWRMREG
jgi:hypothetical protein